MGAEATTLDKYRYHEVFMASGDDIDGPSPWKCGGSMWKFVEVFFSWTHNLSRPVLETYPRMWAGFKRDGTSRDTSEFVILRINDLVRFPGYGLIRV